jgi:hypothetical protein
VPCPKTPTATFPTIEGVSSSRSTSHSRLWKHNHRTRRRISHRSSPKKTRGVITLSAQRINAQHARMVVICAECAKPRVIFSPTQMSDCTRWRLLRREFKGENFQYSDVKVCIITYQDTLSLLVETPSNRELIKSTPSEAPNFSELSRCTIKLVCLVTPLL